MRHERASRPAVNAEIAALVSKHSLNLKAWRLWHFDDLCALLDVHKDVRITYGGFLTTGDVLAQINEWLGGRHHDLQAALTAYAIKEMIAQQYVRLGQAGDSHDENLPSAVSRSTYPPQRPHQP